MLEFAKRFFPGMSPEAALLLDANASRSTPRVHNHIGGGPVFRPRNDGLEASIYGFGAGVKVGDYILISNRGSGSGQSRYRVTKIRYATDPSDQWFAETVFDRRTVEQMDHDDTWIKKGSRYWDALA